jgi:prefoldin subunit 5
MPRIATRRASAATTGAAAKIVNCGDSVSAMRTQAMSELDKLRKENKKLRALLKNALDLLNKSKDALTRAAAPRAKKKKAKMKA